MKASLFRFPFVRLTLRAPLSAAAVVAVVAIAGGALADETPKPEAATPAANEATADAPQPAVTPLAWNPEGIKAAQELAAKLRAGGLECDQCEDGGYGFYDPKVMARIPAPQAVLSCTSVDGEDITFNMFASAEESEKFITIKRDYLCRRASRIKDFVYPGIPYVIGGSWVIEPDERATAEKIGGILGAKAAVAACKDVPPTKAPEKKD